MTNIVQSTGVYPQFTMNGACYQTNNRNNSANGLNSQNSTESKDEFKSGLKSKKVPALIGLAATIAGVVYYKKGVGLMEKKAEFLKEKGVKTLDEWKNSIKPNEEEIKAAEELFKSAEAHQNGIVGKIHSGLNRIGKFFQDNFYNY